MKAAIYLRVSTEEQRERQSIATQRDFAERYCALHEIPVTDFYADDGVSGTVSLEQRLEGSRLLKDARGKRFNSVLIYRLDRLGRDPRLILNAVKELEDLGVEVKSMTEPFDTSSPSGRFLLTILSGVAGLERDTIIQRCVEGINRLAREGAWVGGIVPYGYRVEGVRREARLAVSEARVPRTDLTEAGVIRLIFRMAGDEGQSCIAIADHLNQLGIPPAYARDAGELERGKRRRTTSGRWRDSRIRYILRNPTYKGIHFFGKHRRNPQQPRPVVERSVPAIVDQGLWERAQRTLRRNLLFSRRNARRKYLLRGLIKCGHCGRTYIGTAHGSAKRPYRVYYVCNGRHQGRKACPDPQSRCRAKTISGDIENLVWSDLEQFLRNPGAVVRELTSRLNGMARGSAVVQSKMATLKLALTNKDDERNRIIGLFRRGRIDTEAVDRQLQEIEAERTGLLEQMQQLGAQTTRLHKVEAQLRTAEDLLHELNCRLGQPLTWELRRQLVETLVEGIQVEDFEHAGERDSRVTVTYRFSVPDSSIAPHTPGRTTAWPPAPCQRPQHRARAPGKWLPPHNGHRAHDSAPTPSSPRGRPPPGGPAGRAPPPVFGAARPRCRPSAPTRAPSARPRRTVAMPLRPALAQGGCRRGIRSRAERDASGHPAPSKMGPP